VKGSGERLEGDRRGRTKEGAYTLKSSSNEELVGAGAAEGEEPILGLTTTPAGGRGGE